MQEFAAESNEKLKYLQAVVRELHAIALKTRMRMDWMGHL